MQLAILSPEKTTQAFFAYYQFENFFNLDLLHQAFRFQPVFFSEFYRQYLVCRFTFCAISPIVISYPKRLKTIMKRGLKTRQTAPENTESNCLIACHTPPYFKFPNPKTTSCGFFTSAKGRTYEPASQLFLSEGRGLAIDRPLAGRLASPKIALPTLEHSADLVAYYL